MWELVGAVERDRESSDDDSELSTDGCNVEGSVCGKKSKSSSS